MSSSETSIIKINFVIHISIKGIELTESEVNSLFQHIGYPLFLCETRNIEIEGKYKVNSDSGVVHFVDNESGIEMNSMKFLKKLAKNHRVYLHGTFEIDESEFLSLIDTICCHIPEHVISWSCRPDCIFDRSSEELSSTFDVTSFRFGNVINGNRFVCHLNDFQTKIGKRFGLMSDITVRLSHRTQEMVLRFKLSYCTGSNQELKHVRCKFIFDFPSIIEIITSANYASDFYLRLDYPPRFLVKEGNSWNQWTDCEIISREIIGKCKVLRIRMELEDSDELIDYMIPEFYSIFRNRACNFVCVPMENYCIDHVEDATDRNLPFEVKYTLQCINSLSFAFADDLIVNNNQDAFYNLIESLVMDGRTNLVTEALTRLFNSYFYGNPDVLDAFESLNALVKTIGEETEVSQKTEDKIQCMKRIILTPMRTIFLPPSSSETKFISANSDLSRLIKVHLRDDDHSHACSSPYPYLSEGFGESDFANQIKDSKCRTFFLKQLIGRKLFGEHGLLSKNSYKYHGSSLTELFMEGIIVEAQV
ncbi:uncharacterized protein LOC128396101 [Panonychus citri]|uniref:uncharacterized protein LOC128396101 n=1 Tax=Panonychus citri TaxID=50023 RepID=UPI002307B70E|nr:uncharacterized protein LOC128396101 [Panonychus citri]